MSKKQKPKHLPIEEESQKDQSVNQDVKKQSKLALLQDEVKKQNQIFFKQVQELTNKEIEQVKNKKEESKQEQPANEKEQVQITVFHSLKKKNILDDTMEEQNTLTLQQEIEQRACQFSIDSLLKIKVDQENIVTFGGFPNITSVNDLRSIQEEIQNLRILEQKQEQKKKYVESFYGMKIEENDRELDSQVEESWECSYSYQMDKTISIKYYDFIKLHQKNYVNDTIINFFLRFIENELLSKEQRDPVFMFNTYFSAKLVPYEKFGQLSDKDIPSLYQLYQNAQTQLIRWTKDDILAKQILIFPLHLKEHWSVLIAINPMSICLQMNGVEIVAQQDKGYFVYMDSLQIFDEKILPLIKLQYLLTIFNQKKEVDPKFTENQIIDFAFKSNIDFYQPIIPRQVNLVDCGVYALEYVESFLMNPSFITCNIQTDKLKWFPRLFIITKRLLLKRLLLNISTKSLEFSVQAYKQQRQALLDRASNFLLDLLLVNNPNQYDEIIEKNFDWYYRQQKKQPEHLARLKFYLNTDYNYYEGESI